MAKRFQVVQTCSSMLLVVLAASGCTRSASAPPPVAVRDAGNGAPAVHDARSYVQRCPAASRAAIDGGIAACPADLLPFGKPRPILAAKSFGPGVKFRTVHQYALGATRPGKPSTESFVVLFGFPLASGDALSTTVLELPAADRTRAILALGPHPSNTIDPRQFEALVCSESECAFFVQTGAVLERDRALAVLPRGDYRRVDCRQPGDTCELCVESPTLRQCFAAGAWKSEAVVQPDPGLCCPVASEHLGWTLAADFRGLSRLALTRTGDLLNDRSVSVNNGPCCVQGSGFADALAFDVVVCGASSNPMILTGSTLYGTTSCAVQ